MNAMTVVALVAAVPCVIIPAALVWYLNLGGIMAAVREARARKATLRRLA